MNARWGPDPKTKSGCRLYLPGAFAYIEYRPTRKAWDVIDPYGSKVGYREVPKAIGRTNDLFEAISFVLHYRQRPTHADA